MTDTERRTNLSDALRRYRKNLDPEALVEIERHVLAEQIGGKLQELLEADERAEREELSAKDKARHRALREKELNDLIAEMATALHNLEDALARVSEPATRYIGASRAAYSIAHDLGRTEFRHYGDPQAVIGKAVAKHLTGALPSPGRQ
jgi:hypothetical protein